MSAPTNLAEVVHDAIEQAKAGESLLVLTERGPAPYVGRPFVYEWRVAMDEDGRWVAGPAELVYLPRDWYAATR